jgi:predicted phage baseplate assembly protein
MLADLSATPALAALSTRSDDDFTIALLDAWAVVCDILTFYQERIANESYLRTATELVSVGELAKLIGYKLRPGLAAAAALSFTIDTPPAVPPSISPLTGLPNPTASSSSPPSGSPSGISLGPGIQVQTVPDPGAQPATFETVTPISARAQWNAMGVRTSIPPAPVAANITANVRLTGLAAGVKVGDSLLVDVPASGQPPRLSRVAAITLDPTTQTTVVQFEANQSQVTAAPPTGAASPPTAAPLDDAFLWTYVKGTTWPDQTQLVAFATAQGWDTGDLEAAINGLRQSLAPDACPPISVYAMGTDAALFGHNAQNYASVPSSVQAGPDWEGYTLATIPTTSLPWVDLDNVYPVVTGNWVVLEAYTTPLPVAVLASQSGAFAEIRSRAMEIGPGLSETVFRLSPEWITFPTKVADVQVVSRAAYLMSAKLTSISLACRPPHPADFGLRDTRVLVQTAQLPVADVVDDSAVSGGSLTLDGACLSLAVGQLAIVTGLLTNQQGQTASEVVSIASLALVDGYTVLSLSTQLTGSYVRASVSVNANVARATDGATTTEILGSGDASQTFQSFRLSQPPLTYVSAATATGSASTLTVRVNGVAWTEVPWLYGSGPADRVYTVLQGSDGKTYVQFGDGVTGALPGTGANNIVATYRHGIGSEGVARAGQISTLVSRPLGLKAATNPLASSGAADPETVDQARANAPVSVMTLGRIVSLEDVGDFAAASAGIAKAAASWVWDGSRYVACVTVAGVAGAPVTPGTDQYTSLQQSMLDASDGTLALALCSYVSRTFSVAAAVTPDPALGTRVLAAVKTALAAAFSFNSRSFGQPVFSSEVIATIQDVPGVVAVTLDGFGYSGEASTPPAYGLPAAGPTLGPAGLIGAELLTLEPGTLPGVVLAS